MPSVRPMAEDTRRLAPARLAQLLLVVAVGSSVPWPGSATREVASVGLSYKHLSKDHLRPEDDASAARCQEALGWPHLYIMWEAQSQSNAARFLAFLQAFQGITVLEVHRMRFSRDAQQFADCHRNFYQNNQCGEMPEYSAVFHSPERLKRDKGLGAFTVILYGFDCKAAAHNSEVTDASSPWEGRYLDFHRQFKRWVRDNFASGHSGYTIHGTQNRLEAMVDIRSLFNMGKYHRLEKKARVRKAWDGHSVKEHREPVCPKVMEDPCGTLYTSGDVRNDTVVEFDGVVVREHPLAGFMAAVELRTEYLAALEGTGQRIDVPMLGRVHIMVTIAEGGAVRVPTRVSLEKRYDAAMLLNILKNNQALLQGLLKEKIGSVWFENWRVSSATIGVSNLLNEVRSVMEHVHG